MCTITAPAVCLHPEELKNIGAGWGDDIAEKVK